MKLNLDRAFTGILVLAAVIVAVSAAKSSFSAPIRPEDVPPDFVSQWRDGLAAGHLAAGSPAARVTILGIVDLQCPICGAVHPLLQQVVAAHHGEVRLVYVPNPLPYHRSAMPAALGAQCAQRQGRFAAWVDTIFASQQLLGTRSWQAYATAAGVPDTTRFLSCMEDPATRAYVQAGLAFGASIPIDGTPTILVDGWRLHGAITRRVLDSAVTSRFEPQRD